LFIDRSSDFLNVEEQALASHCLEKELEIFIKCHPMLLSDEMALVAIFARLVNHLRSSVERALESTNLEISFDSLHKLSLSINIISQVNGTLSHEQNHLNIFKLTEDNLALLNFNWL
jgi:hypothetical protein